MQSKAKTVAEYLASLPADRRAAIETVRATILKRLDPKLAEGMLYGMIGYYVPHSVFPPGYHCDPKLPLPYAGLASQKQYMSLYVPVDCGGATEAWFRAAWAKSGRKLDMGKCCVRFKRIDDVALDVVGETFRRLSADDFIAYYVAHGQFARKRPGRKTAAEPAAAKRTAKPVSVKKKAAPAPAKRAVKKATKR